MTRPSLSAVALLAACFIAGPVAAQPPPASLSFFADENDSRILLEGLNADPGLAFIIADGPLPPKLTPEMLQKLLPEKLPPGWQGKKVIIMGRPDTGHRQRWRAVRAVKSLKDGYHSLWYVPAGPLHLVKSDPNVPDSPIPDPWVGWTEERPGAESNTPYFGWADSAVIRLTLWTRHRPYTRAELEALDETISYWTDRHDLLVASHFQWSGGSEQTQQWWSRLEAFMKRVAVPLPARFEPSEVFWAFPSALKKLKAGVRYEARGWDLRQSIRKAPPPR